MSMLFYAGAAEHEWAEIAVDDPGHGYLVITRLEADTVAASSVFAGERLGDLVDRVTSVVIDPDASASTSVPPTSGATLRVSRAEAVELIPPLVRAVALAMADTDRYDRIWAEHAEADPPALCVYCNQGSPYDQVVTISEPSTATPRSPPRRTTLPRPCLTRTVPP